MSNSHDVKVVEAVLYFLPITLRVPLKFGAETTTEVTCIRVALRVENDAGRSAWGWGETPLIVQWFWTSGLSYSERLEATKQFCLDLATEWQRFAMSGHPMEISQDFSVRSR